MLKEMAGQRNENDEMSHYHLTLINKWYINLKTSPMHAIIASTMTCSTLYCDQQFTKQCLSKLLLTNNVCFRQAEINFLSSIDCLRQVPSACWPGWRTTRMVWSTSRCRNAGWLARLWPTSPRCWTITRAICPRCHTWTYLKTTWRTMST